MTVINEKHKKWFQYNSLQKCGQITISKDFLLMGFNCCFCTTIFTRIEEFSKHLKKDHPINISELYSTSSLIYENLQHNSSIEEIAIKVEPNLFNANEINDEFDNFAETDPFEVEWNADVSMELSIKEEAEFFDTSSASGQKRKRRSCTKKEDRKEAISKSCSYKEDTDSAENSDSDYELEAKLTHSPKKGNPNDESSSDCDQIEQRSEQPEDLKIDIDNNSNHAIVLEIIEFYKANTNLWQTCVRGLGKRKKTPSLERLSQQITTNHQIQLNPDEINNIFGSLKKRFYAEKRKLKRCKKQPKLWCFDKMQFLVENKPVAMPTTETFLKIACLYEKFPILWNYDEIEHRNKELIDQAYVQMNDQLNLNLTINELQANIVHLRKEYSKDKEKRFRCEKMQQDFKPSLAELYEKLYFINAYIKPYICHYENCLESLGNHDEFLKHLAKHEGRDPYICKSCPMTYKTFQGLELHVRRHHSGIKPFPCEFCEKFFHSKAECNTHQNSHSESDKKFVCYVCGKAFHTKSYLTKHVRRHQKLHQCPQCPKGYADPYLLESHLNSHNKIRAHICEVCGKGFYAYKTLAQHKQLHSDVENYECNLCGRRFKQISAMHSHKKWFHQRLNPQESL